MSPTDVGPLRLEFSGSWCMPVPKMVKPRLRQRVSSTPRTIVPSGKNVRIGVVRQRLVEVVDRPGGIAEEAMVSAVVPAMDGAGGLDQLGDVAMPEGEAPSGGDGEEGGEGGRGEDRAELE